MSEDLNRAGVIARAAGLRFGFHNHFWEFAGLEDDSPLVGFDIVLAETDLRLVHFELDLYWCCFAHTSHPRGCSAGDHATATSAAHGPRRRALAWR